VDELLSQIENAITAHPSNALLQLLMGRALIIRDCALLGNNCSIRAKGHITKAIELDPKLVRGHTLLAMDAMNGGCLPCARPHLEAAAALEPNNPYVLEARGRFVQSMGDRGQATRLYLDAIERFSNPKKCWQSYTWLSSIYRDAEDYDKAELMLQKALESRPTGAWSYGNLGTFYIFARGDHEKAIPLLRKTLAIMSYELARQGLALAMYERWADAYLKNIDKAIVLKYLDEAIALYPDRETMVLMSASYVGTGRAARALLETKQVPERVLERRWDDDRTPLLLAANNDNTDLALYLLKRGADPNARDRDGATPIYYAALRGNLKVFNALVAGQANVQAVTYRNQTVLVAAVSLAGASADRLKIAATLVDRGVPVDIESPYGSALNRAVVAGQAEIVRYLLAKGARADRRTPNGLTLPAVAIRLGNKAVLKAFLDARAGLDAKIGELSLAEFAEKNHQPEMAAMLRAAKP